MEFTFDDGVRVRLVKRQGAPGFRLVSVDDDWDYEVAEDIAEWNRELRECRSYEECLEHLGVCGY